MVLITGSQGSILSNVSLTSTVNVTLNVTALTISTLTVSSTATIPTLTNTNLYCTNASLTTLTVSGVSTLSSLSVTGESALSGAVTCQGALNIAGLCTGTTGSFQQLIVSGQSSFNGPIVGPTGSFTSLRTNDMTSGTGSFAQLIVSGQSIFNGIVTGPTGSFVGLRVSGVSQLGGIVTGPTGSFSALAVSGNSTLNALTVSGQSSFNGIVTGPTGSFSSLVVSGQARLPGGVTGATGSFSQLSCIGTGAFGGTLYVDAVNNRVGINLPSPAYTLDVGGGGCNVNGVYRVAGTQVLSGTTLGSTVSTLAASTITVSGTSTGWSLQCNQGWTRPRNPAWRIQGTPNTTFTDQQSILNGASANIESYPTALGTYGFITAVGDTFRWTWRSPSSGYYRVTVTIRAADSSSATFGLKCYKLGTNGTTYTSMIPDDGVYWIGSDPAGRRLGSFSTIYLFDVGEALVPSVYDNSLSVKWCSVCIDAIAT